MIDGTSAGRPLAPRVLAFVGDDPGQKGATCLLGVLDDPDGARHGEVVYCAVWDHVLRETDSGPHVDPVNFAAEVRRHTIEAGAADRVLLLMPNTQVVVARIVIERASVQGKAGRFSAGGVITQGTNIGVVLGAALCSSEFTAEVVDVVNASGGAWQAESGTPCPRGTDSKAHSVDVALALLRSWGWPGGVDCHTSDRVRVELPPNGITLAKNDRADALRLAHLGVLRWLGRTVAPADAGRTASTRTRAKAARDHEVARAMEGVDRKAMRKVSCPRCGALTAEKCEGGKSICRERVWTAAAASKPQVLIVDSTNINAFMTAMRGSVPGTPIACAQGVWRRVLTDGTRDTKVPREALDAAIDAGLVRLTLDAKRRPVWVTAFREAPTTPAGVVLG